MPVRIWKLSSMEPGFDKIYASARKQWNNDLSRITVEGGTKEQKTVFYTALYHTLIHPNILQDVNGEYPAMETGETKTTKTIVIPYILCGIPIVTCIS